MMPRFWAWSLGEGGSQFWGPPGVVPESGVAAEYQHFHLVRVELHAVVSHPFGNAHHASVEVVSGGGWVFWE